MPETKQLLRETRDRIAPPTDVLDGLDRRRRHQENIRRGAAAAVAIVVALLGIGGWFLLDRNDEPTPADRSDELGIFAPVAGRIVYQNEGGVAGYGDGPWAVDPNAPADTVDGPTVADDVVSTLVPLDLENIQGLEAVTLHGWSRKGTELLFQRSEEYSNENLFPMGYLYILHADGSETRLNQDEMLFGGAAISADGSRVAFAAWGDDLGLYVVDAEGGKPVRLPLPGAEGIVTAPTFSPDGTQIAYLDTSDRETHVWVMDADGSNARKILTNEDALFGGASGLQWSPAGDRIAVESGRTEAIYTFTQNGSDFTRVITDGFSPYWSPDGTRIAYTVACDLTEVSCGGLAIADADGSNVKEFGYAASGPWHPGVSTTEEPTTEEPAPNETDEGFPRTDGEVLRFTGEGGEAGDLVAVYPQTGEERVLVEDLEAVNSASWSPDGRSVAYETQGPDGKELWVVSSSRKPRRVAAGATMLAWSSTGAEIATIRPFSEAGDIAGSTFSTIDLKTGETTDVGSIPERVGDITSPPAWSPDGTRFVFGARGGAIYSIDGRSGTHSLLVRLPGENLDSVDQVEWSPDGAHIAIMNDGVPGGVFVIDADGSNVRRLLDDRTETTIAWSPDGTRLAYRDLSGAVWVAPMDGSAPIEIGTPLPTSAEALLSQLDLTWSPDGSWVAFRNIGYLTGGDVSVDVSAIDADGSGDVERIDELTYRSWDGGSYSCECA